MQCGYQRRTREIVDWARSKRRRYIRRDELLSYLAGKPPPPPSIHVTKNNQLRLNIFQQQKCLFFLFLCIFLIFFFIDISGYRQSQRHTISIVIIHWQHNMAQQHHLW